MTCKADGVPVRGLTLDPSDYVSKRLPCCRRPIERFLRLFRRRLFADLFWATWCVGAFCLNAVLHGWTPGGADCVGRGGAEEKGNGLLDLVNLSAAFMMMPALLNL